MIHLYGLCLLDDSGYSAPFDTGLEYDRPDGH